MPIVDGSKQVDIINFSDLHTNSTTGLCRPVVNLDEGGTYHASPFQRSLYAGYLEIIQEARIRSQGRELVAILNGDLTELDAKNRDVQIITRNKADILRMSIEVLEPLLAICDRWYVIRGTAAHTGKGSWAEEAIANDIGAITESVKQDAEGKPIGPFSYWHLRRIFGGYRFDIAHHIRGNTKNAANRLAQDVIRNYAIRGEQVPHFAVRAHCHRVFDSGYNFPVRAISSPCMEGATSFVYRIGGENDIPELGALYFQDGDVKVIGIKIHPRKWVVG